MNNQQQDERANQVEEQTSSSSQTTPVGNGGYQTPVESDIRKTAQAAQTDAKPTAVPESGSSDQLAEGGGNQGTQKR